VLQPLVSVGVGQYIGATKGKKVARLVSLVGICVLGEKVGETWSIVPRHSGKREVVHCAECYLCGWMVFEQEHRVDAHEAIKGHIMRIHRGWMRDASIREELRSSLQEAGA
jgi:hypothetical protein